MKKGDRVLSMIQPWAELVVTGIKKQETRSWNTKYRGELFIHASAKIPTEVKNNLDAWPFDKYQLKLHKGAILGRVELYDVITSEEAMKRMRRLPTSEWDTEYSLGDYSPGRFIWLFRNPIEFDEPILAKGSLGIWTYKGK